MLDSPLPSLRAEAARAAGELEIGAAASRLLELLDDPDEATRLASIWSLSQLVEKVCVRRWIVFMTKPTMTTSELISNRLWIISL